jgi:serine/threonine protein kinase
MLTQEHPGGPPCPSRADLAGFREGRLRRESIDSIGAHLSSCPACERLLQEMDADSDALTQNLRALGTGLANPFADDPEYLRMELVARRFASTAYAESHIQPLAEPDRPALLGVYQLGEKIGGGGMGAVYRAFHTKLKKWVALKVLRPDRVDDPQVVIRFQREMEAVGRLDHPNIIRATDAGEVGGVHFLVMDLVEGIDLGKLVQQGGPLPVAEACELVRQAALGLQYAHERGLVHRDVKPSNLLLSLRGVLKVLDLGLARLVDHQQTADEVTHSGQIMGTTGYMAPEQWESGHTVDIRADLYSLGCTLYMLLTGSPPFSGPAYRSLPQKMSAHLHKAPPRVDEARPGVPRGLADVVAKLLAKGPADRHQTPRELAKALAPFASGARVDQLAGRHARPGAAVIGDTPVAEGLTRPDQDRTGRLPPWIVMMVSSFLLASVLVFLSRWLAPAPVRLLPAPEEPAPRTLVDEGEYDLLDRRPVEVDWPEKWPNARWDHDAKQRKLWATCLDFGMLELAQVGDAPFELDLKLFQQRWHGGMGVYVRRRPAGPDRTVQSDVISLTRFPDLSPTQIRLDRSVAEQRDDGTLLQNLGVIAGEADFSHPGEHHLQVRVGSQGIEQVLWDCKPVPRLIVPCPDHADARSGAGGGVGLLFRDTTCVIHSVRLRILPSPEEKP